MKKTLSSIANKQASATENVRAELNHFLDYAHTHPDAEVRYRASDMILALHSDGSFNSEPNSKSRAGGHFYLTERGNVNLGNGAVHALTEAIKFVTSSAGETEVAASFINCRKALPMRIALEEMGHPQPKTPVIMDNTTAIGLMNKTMAPKASKAYDMRLNWLKCREAQKQFDMIWQPGKKNLADYHTKTHTNQEYMSKRKDHVQN